MKILCIIIRSYTAPQYVQYMQFVELGQSVRRNYMLKIINIHDKHFLIVSFTALPL